MNFIRLPRGLFAPLLLLAACSTIPVNNEPCSFENAGYCSADGQLTKVCASNFLSPTAPDLRWRDAPPPNSAKTTCGCVPDPKSGAPSAACITVQADEGELCVTPTADRFAGGTIAADQPLNLHVQLPGCAPGCASDIVETCSVKRDGSTLRVSSYFSASAPVSALCPAGCRFQIADCISEPLPAGQYTLILGSQTLHLTVPSTVPDAGCGGFF